MPDRKVSFTIPPPEHNGLFYSDQCSIAPQSGSVAFCFPPTRPADDSRRHSYRWRIDALTTTSATANRGDKVTSGGHRACKNPLATAARP